jgi:hypothetical protein
MPILQRLKAVEGRKMVHSAAFWIYNLCSQNFKYSRFSKLMDKFDDVISKKTNVKRDNRELRTSNLNHTSTLEKEILKTNLESKCTLNKMKLKWTK